MPVIGRRRQRRQETAHVRRVRQGLGQRLRGAGCERDRGGEKDHRLPLEEVIRFLVLDEGCSFPGGERLLCMYLLQALTYRAWLR